MRVGWVENKNGKRKHIYNSLEHGRYKQLTRLIQLFRGVWIEQMLSFTDESGPYLQEEDRTLIPKAAFPQERN